ncbi:MAG: ABC transporter permease [Alcaligenaceae bacterium]|nr:ABC transporter permease [Alcaligenaceae bacterium]
MFKKIQSVSYSAIGLLVLITFWQLTLYFLKDSVPIAASLAPLPAAYGLWDLLSSGEIYPHIVSSLLRVAVGLAVALLIGVPVGLCLGLNKRIEMLTGLSFQLLRMVSPLAWMPIAVMIFGVGNAPVFFLLAMAAVWPIMLNTTVGVRQIPPSFMALGNSLSATPWEMLSKIVLPAILASILTGVRLAVGVLWIVLVPAEMLGVNEGLGYFILDTRDRLAYSELTAAIVIISLLGWCLDYLARRLMTLATKSSS